MSESSLDRYRAKRDLGKSGEPPGSEPAKTAAVRAGAIFVIQKHAASTLHYDFRIALCGVLKSWAIPKGPSTDPRDKRLAIRTEDHPLEYALFEGVIPKGHYGAGAVLVWDLGTYRNLKRESDERFLEALERDGHIAIWLEGQKLRGGYALTRTRDEQWLFVKMRDRQADARRNPVGEQPESVLTNRTIEQIASERSTEHAHP